MRFALLTLAFAACSSYGDGTPGVEVPPRDGGGEASVTPTDAGAADTAGDAVPTDSGACLGALDCERLVFVTSSKGDGDQGGLDGADAECQELANTSPKTAGHKFKAWLSAAGIEAQARLPHGTRAYRRVDNVLVQNNFAGFVQGNVLAPIEIDEKGGNVGNEPVWTATRGNGSVVGDACENWVSNGAAISGRRGSSGSTNAQWTDSGDEPCSTQHRLYCFEN